jgi:mono/diheme cytochrome c family protein
LKSFLSISSLATLALLIVAAASENYLSEWRGVQREYQRVLLSKAEDEAEVKSARAFNIEIRQIVVPDLGNVDRCVTCHLGLDDPRMATESQPFAAHPGPFLEDHETESFGCTTCHMGQGRATSSREAHAWEGEVFWDRPLLPAPFNQSSCGVCHDPEHLGSRGAPALARGFELFRAEGCLGCHKLGGRGGPLGPSLDAIGDKSKHAYPFAHVSGEKQVWNWHLEHFRVPQEVVPNSKMPVVELEEEDLAGLVTYLLSLRTTNLTERMTPRDRYEQRYQVWHTPPLTGAELYRQFCFACHEEGIETVLHDTLEVAISSIRNPDFLAVATHEFLVESIREGRPTTYMPGWDQEAGGLTEEELSRIADYLLEARREVREVSFVVSEAADAGRGEEIFTAECIDCHGLTREEGEAPWLGDPGFQKTYSDALIGHNIKYGREDTLMIPYGEEADGDLTDEQISDLVAFIRTMG